MKRTLVALAVLGLGASAVHAQEVIKLGAAAPLTGTQSHLGKDIENGVRLALEDYNAKGVTLGGKKVKFEVMAEDDAAVSPMHSLRYYEALSARGVPAQLHVYPRGGHSFAFDDAFPYKALWLAELERFLGEV